MLRKYTENIIPFLLKSREQANLQKWKEDSGCLDWGCKWGLTASARERS